MSNIHRQYSRYRSIMKQIDGRLCCLRLDEMKEFYSEEDWVPPYCEQIEVMYSIVKR